MNKSQLIVLWLAGLLISGVFFNTGQKLLYHAETTKEVLETGYPFTLVIGTGWAYILPIVIIGALLAISVKGKK